MAFNDNAVFTASTGFIYTAPVGTAAPTPQQLKNFDPETFGFSSASLKATGTTEVVFSPQSAQEAKVPATASAAEVQEALNKKVLGANGDAVVRGNTLKEGLTVSFLSGRFAVNLPNDVIRVTGAAWSDVTQPSGWEPIGHTANDDLPEFGYDGGDSETKGSWQKKVLRTITSETPVDYMTLKAIQFDPDTLEYYYGKNASRVANVFGVDSPNASDVERAILVVLKDGKYSIAFSAAKAGLRRDESISLENDEFATLPLRATFVKHPGRHLFEWTTPAA